MKNLNMMFIMHENISFVWDVKIFFKTIATVLTHDCVYNDASSLSEEVMTEKVLSMRNINENNKK